MSDHDDKRDAQQSIAKHGDKGDPHLGHEEEAGMRGLPDDLGDRDEILILEHDLEVTELDAPSPIHELDTTPPVPADSNITTSAESGMHEHETGGDPGGDSSAPDSPAETGIPELDTSTSMRDPEPGEARKSLVFLEQDEYVDAELTEGNVQPMVVEEVKKTGHRSALLVAAACISILVVAGAVYFLHVKPTTKSAPARVAAAAKPAIPHPAPPARLDKDRHTTAAPVSAIEASEPAPVKPGPSTAPASTNTLPPATPVATAPEADATENRDASAPDSSGAGSPSPRPTSREPDRQSSKTASSAPEPRSVPDSRTPVRPTPTPIPSPMASPDRTGGTDKTASPPSQNRSEHALHELIHLGLNEGFSRLVRKKPAGRSGIKVHLRGGKEVALNPGESLVELKNGNHFKGHIALVKADHIVLSFTYGTIRIPKRDLNHVVPSDSRNDAPLEEYRSGIVRLRNGNRLTGKVVKVTDDRVVLGFPSAQIVVPRTAMAQGAEALEFTEAEGRRKLLGAGPSFSSPDPSQEASTPVKVKTFLGAPYYDFVNGFSLIPPRGWDKFAKDAIIGFASPETDKVEGLLTLGGLYMEANSLKDALQSLSRSLPGTIAGVTVEDTTGTAQEKNVPWEYSFDTCLRPPAPASGTTASQNNPCETKVCRTYVYNRFGRVFVLNLFAFEKDFAKRATFYDQCAETFDFKN